MRYDAFISYRHSDLDMYVAKKIHKGLETFKVPRAVTKKTGKKNIKRVFRDQEELPIGSDLGDNIEGALAESEFLVVICSPRTPESYWVQKEISTFIGMHGREHILAVLIEGEPNESFPEQLLVDDEGKPVEPLAADVRGANKREVDKKLKTEIMRLAAPLLHCSYDDLRQRHRERKMKHMAAGFGAVAALAVLFGAYNAYNAAMIQQNYEGKQRNQSKYLADTSLSLLEIGDRRAAVLVAMEALPSAENDRPYVAEAQYALSQALYCYDTGNVMKMDRILQHALPVSDFCFNQDGTRIASIDEGDTIYVWDVETGKELARIAPQIKETGYILGPLEVMLYEDTIVVCEDYGLRSLTYDGQEQWKVESESYITYCKMDETSLMAACVNNDEVVFYDIVTGEKIATMPNQQDTAYTDAFAWSDDKTKFAVAHLTMDEDATSGCVSVYDFETGEIIDVETVASFISEVIFTSDNHLVVAQSDFNDLLNYGHGLAPAYIQKIDYKTQAVLWQDSYEYQVLGYESASTQLKYRNYQDAATGEEHKEILLSIDNKAYTWDDETGVRIAEVTVDSGIMDFLIVASSGIGFLAQDNGTVDIVDMTNGTRYSDSATVTGMPIRQLMIRNGVMAFRSYASPDLTIMKYPNAADVVEVDEFEQSISEVTYSAEETYYAIEVYDIYVDTRISFYRTEDNSFVREWVEEDGGLSEAMGFVDDNTFVTADRDGTVIFYDVESGEKNVLSAGEEFSSADYTLNESGTFAVIYDGYDYGLIDIQKQKVLFTGESEVYLRGLVLSEDGTRAYCNTNENGVCILRLETGEITYVELPGYHVLSSLDRQGAFAISKSGNLLAVSCSDSILRVLDVEKMETVEEVPFAGVSRRFIEFAENDARLMLQGDDYYFRVYDLEKDEFVYIATNQYYEIKDAVLDEQTGTISLVTAVDMVILNLEDYERIAQVDGGKAYLPKHGRILSSYNRSLYQFPYMTLEMLQDEAREQFAGEELTELERIRFNVE